MSNSIYNAQSTGDAIEYIEYNVDYLERIEDAIRVLQPQVVIPLKGVAEFLELHIKTNGQLKKAVSCGVRQ